MGQRMAVDGISHHLNNLRRMQHANFHCVNANVFNNGINLVSQHLRRHAMNGAHTGGVLRRQRGDGRHAKATQCSKRFQVSLNARAAATV